MICADEIAKALGVPCLISGGMQKKMQLWDDLYQNRASWQKKRVKSLRLPAAIARELKRLTLTEFEIATEDMELNAPLQLTKRLLRRSMDYGIAIGGLLLKPYYSGGVQMDMVAQNQYLPVRYTDDTCTSVVCPEEIAIGKTYYTRLEFHDFDSLRHTHTIQQRCFRSGMPGMLGTECSLTDVPQWADILPEKTYDNAAHPLFAIFQMPDANNIDPTSPLGISAYADAVDLIHDADVHWERILWELESSERAIDASEDLFRYQNGKPVLPQGRERMFRCLERTGNANAIFNTFSPEVRDSSYFNAFNQMLRRIESTVGLSYGTLSEVSDVEKTAEEIRSSKQRSFVRISDMQSGLKSALEGLLYGFQYYRDYYSNTSSAAPAELTCTFGDGVLEDVDKEFQRRSQMVRDKILKPELLLSWYFGCSEEEASEMMPQQMDAGGLFDGGGF
ncbi:MAG: hypothetical protein ACI4JQ_06350 [Ruminococcus sp.]